MKWKTKFGHMILGKGRYAGEKDGIIHLDCGCTLKKIKREGHIWTIELNFENCRNHKCSDRCLVME